MNTQAITRILAIASAALALTTAAAAQSPAQTPVRQGPGPWSVKSSQWFSYHMTAPAGNTSGGALYFHTSTGMAAVQSPVTHQGPGPWSVKSPLWSKYNRGGTF